MTVERTLHLYPSALLQCEREIQIERSGSASVNVGCGVTSRGEAAALVIYET